MKAPILITRKKLTGFGLVLHKNVIAIMVGRWRLGIRLPKSPKEFVLTPGFIGNQTAQYRDLSKKLNVVTRDLRQFDPMKRKQDEITDHIRRGIERAIWGDPLTRKSDYHFKVINPLFDGVIDPVKANKDEFEYLENLFSKR
jgi:hypothetical protein